MRLFSYFELDDLTRLMNAIAGSGMPAGVRVHVGTYGVNREASITVHTYGLGRYCADVQGRGADGGLGAAHAHAEEERKVGRRFAGRVPDEAVLLRLSSAQRIAWGVEVGRRYRDTIRHARADRDHGREWQLDELGTQLAGSRAGSTVSSSAACSRASRLVGACSATARARAGSGRRDERSTSPRLPVTAELSAFWQQLDRASFRVVGEEFPNFVGDPPAPRGRRRTASVRWPPADRCGAASPGGTSPG